MFARRVFFSFHYKHVFRVNQIRRMPNIVGRAAAGFQEVWLWERAKRQGHTEIKRLIREGLKNTSVTVVCITYGTKNRTYINDEIEQSLKRRNGLVGIQIHHLADPSSPDDRVGENPPQIEANGFKIYKYENQDRLKACIEEADRLAGRS